MNVLYCKFTHLNVFTHGLELWVVLGIFVGGVMNGFPLFRHAKGGNPDRPHTNKTCLV